MFIGLISDTHGVFPEDVKKFLEPVDVIWHAGDFGGGLALADEIRKFKPLVGVYGNIDGADLRKEYPRVQKFECEGLKVMMTHIGLRKGSYWAFNPGARKYDIFAESEIESYRPDIFVCGHTHIPQVFRDSTYGFILMNPGACGYEGPREVPRMALRFKISGGVISSLEKCVFPR